MPRPELTTANNMLN